jgi:serine/threonine-protein kinase
LCGHPPFVRGGLGLVLGAHIYAPVPPPRSVEPRVSEAMEAVVMRALEKDVNQRYQSLREFASALEQAVLKG